MINLKIEKTAVIKLSDKCNSHCEGCFSRTNSEYEVLFNEGKRFIDEVNLLGIKNIFFEGGEPTINFFDTSLPKLIKHSKTKGINPTIITNGNWNNLGSSIEDFLEIIKTFDVNLVFSIDIYHNTKKFNTQPIPSSEVFSNIQKYLDSTGNTVLDINQRFDEQSKEFNIKILYGKQGLKNYLDNQIRFKVNHINADFSETVPRYCPSLHHNEMMLRLDEGQIKICSVTVSNPISLGAYTSEKNITEMIFDLEQDTTSLFHQLQTLSFEEILINKGIGLRKFQKYNSCAICNYLNLGK